jgi:hypothetical protein
VVQDIAPYQSAVTGEAISGRRQHRDHLRAHGLQEVGNEKPTMRPPPIDSSWVKPALRETYNQLRLTGAI